VEDAGGEVDELAAEAFAMGAAVDGEVGAGECLEPTGDVEGEEGGPGE
jgi:hypothetical protein